MTARKLREEIANSVTHGFGLALSIAALVVLIVAARVEGGSLRIVSFAVFGASLVLLYLASTTYHSFRWTRLRRLLRYLDHAAIYILIAGTYTPFVLLNMRGALGWSVFGIVWGLAVLGISLKALHMDRFAFLSPLIYIVMGWLGILMIKPAMEAIHPGGLGWLLAGGITYTLGVIFYSLEKLPYNHAVWHGFVLGGSTCHFIAVLFYATATTGL